MIIEKLEEIMTEHNIPKNVKIMSDSGWECDPTNMDGVWYNSELNLIIFTQNYDKNYIEHLCYRYRNYAYGYEEDWKYIGLKET